MMSPDPSATETVARPRRRDALRQLLQRDQLRECARVARAVPVQNSALAGAQAAITSAIALPLVWLSPWSGLIGFVALGGLVALLGRFAPRGERGRIVLVSGLLQVLAVLNLSALGWLAAPIWLQHLCLAALCGVFLFLAVTLKLGAPGALIFVFAAGAALSAGTTSGDQLPARAMATAAGAAVAFVVCALTEVFRAQPTAGRPLPREVVPPLRDRLLAAGRTVIGAVIAIFLADALGAGHPAWAAMGALAVIQGVQLNIVMSRALQRMAGTVLGAALAWIVLRQAPSAGTVIAILLLLQVTTETVIGFNYAFGLIFVTPMALLMTYLASGSGAGPEMAPERIFDTFLGAVIGIGVALALSGLEERRQLARLRQPRRL